MLSDRARQAPVTATPFLVTPAAVAAVAGSRSTP